MSEANQPAAEPESELNAIPVDTTKCPSCGEVIDVKGLEAFSQVLCPSCGTAITVPAKFDHFLLLKHLGSGGMGSAFLAEDEQLGRQVAVKVMQKSLGSDPKAFEVFKNEAQSAARLNHPHVAQIHSFGAFEGTPYLEMELVPGGSLQDFIDNKTKLDPAFVIRVGYEIAQGLLAAEGVGLFHGDVKPDNILFDADMNSKLVDFGIASRANQGKSEELWGTPYYIAPEKVQKKVNSARSDIYSLGATLYHAIALQPPYDAADAVEVIRARFKGPPPPLEEIRPDVEPEVSRIVSRMMYNDLFMRYPNYNSLLGDMQKYLEGVSSLRKMAPKSPKLSHNLITGLVPVAEDGNTRGGKKKFVIQKGQMEAAEQQREINAAAQDTMTGRMQASGKKTIHFTKKKRNSSHTGAFAAVTDAEAQEGSGERDASRGGGGGIGLKLVFFLVVGLGGLAILSVIGYFLYQVISSGESEKQAAELKASAETLVDAYVAMEDQIRTNVVRITEINAKVDPIFKTIQETVSKATRGQELVIPDLEPPPEPTPEELAAAAAAEEAAAQAEAAPEASKEPALTRLAKKRAAALGVANPSLTDLMAMVEAIKKEAKEAELEPEIFALKELGEPVPEPEAPADAPAEEAADEGGEVADEAGDGFADEGGEAAEEGGEGDAPAEPVVTESPLLKKTLDRIVEPAKTIRAALRKCERIAANETENPDPSFDSIPKNAPDAVVIRTVTQRREAIERRRQLIADMAVMIDNAEKALQKLQVAQQQVARDARPYLNRIQREDQEAANKRRAEELAAAKEAEEAAKRARDDEEINRVRSVAAGYQNLVDTFQYEKYKEQMSRMEGELLTDAGKAELKLTIGRMDNLISLRAWILSDLKARELRKGFRNRYDIRGVSVNGKDLLLGQSRPNFPIADLTIGDWVGFFWPLLQNRPTNRTGLSTHERGTQLWNAAVFCYMHANGNHQALERCKQLAEAAFQYRSALRTDAEKVIPILAEGAAVAPAEDDALSDF